MQEFVAHTSRKRTALLVIGSIAFVITGLWKAGFLGPVPVSPRHDRATTLWVGWLSIVFFGMTTLQGARLWWENKVQIHVGHQGIRIDRWSDQLIPWADIVDARLQGMGRQTLIVLKLRRPGQFPARGIMKIFGAMNRPLTDGEICLSLFGTDRSAGEAMEAIKLFRPGM